MTVTERKRKRRQVKKDDDDDTERTPMLSLSLHHKKGLGAPVVFCTASLVLALRLQLAQIGTCHHSITFS